jgi:hypothetical protein
MVHSRSRPALYDGRDMPTPDLSLVPSDRITAAGTEGVPDEIREQLNNTQRHLLQQAEAIERVVAMIPVPRPLAGTQHALTLLLDQALWARAIADRMQRPLMDERMPLDQRQRRAIQAGPSLGAAENTAQYALQLFRAQLVAEWPVTLWNDALTAIVQAGASEGAWDLVGNVAEGLAGGPGSADWWHAVLYVEGLWGDRHYQRFEPVAG